MKRVKPDQPKSSDYGQYDSNLPKKRFVWTAESHEDFLRAIFDVGLQLASVETLGDSFPLCYSSPDIVKNHIQLLVTFVRSERFKALSQSLSYPNSTKPFNGLHQSRSCDSLGALDGDHCQDENGYRIQLDRMCKAIVRQHNHIAALQQSLSKQVESIRPLLDYASKENPSLLDTISVPYSVLELYPGQTICQDRTTSGAFESWASSSFSSSAFGPGTTNCNSSTVQSGTSTSVSSSSASAPLRATILSPIPSLLPTSFPAPTATAVATAATAPWLLGFAWPASSGSQSVDNGNRSTTSTSIHGSNIPSDSFIAVSDASGGPVVHSLSSRAILMKEMQSNIDLHKKLQRKQEDQISMYGGSVAPPRQHPSLHVAIKSNRSTLMIPHSSQAQAHMADSMHGDSNGSAIIRLIDGNSTALNSGNRKRLSSVESSDGINANDEGSIGVRGDGSDGEVNAPLEGYVWDVNSEDDADLFAFLNDTP